MPFVPSPASPPPTRIISFLQRVQEVDPLFRQQSLRPVAYDFSNGRRFLQPVDVYSPSSPSNNGDPYMGLPIQNFQPDQNFEFTANGTSQNQAFTQYSPPSGQPLTAIRMMNLTNAVMYVAVGNGAQTASAGGANSYAVGPGEDSAIAMNAGSNNFAVYAAGTGKYNIAVGNGS
jgi:hypothetical protein